jgi:plasmid stabilization system protein ParE
MPQLIWTPPALRDVQRLYRFLANKNPDAAKRAVTAIRQGVRILVSQPKVGRVIDDLPEEFREWPIDFGSSGYLVRYRIEVDMVVVLAVWHQREAGY